MTVSPTQTPPELDGYQSRLLAELRGVVQERAASAEPAPQAMDDAPARAGSRWVRRLSLTAAAAALAVGAVIANFGGDPPYAVAEGEGGDIVVTIHELEDADGLEAALAAEGVTADVSYEATPQNIILEGASDAPVPPYDEAPPDSSTAGDVPPELVDDIEQQCGFGPGEPPINVTEQGGDYTFTIPADSDLTNRVLKITTFQEPTDGSNVPVISVSWAPADGAGECGVVQVGT